jgi:hypothetical protein
VHYISIPLFCQLTFSDRRGKNHRTPYLFRPEI